MGYIKILDESVSNIIAAGEVVENSASMIKELIENSLDAKASIIKIEVFNGGLDVKISDNGVGMDKEDTLLSIERHATSKIKTKEDVFNLMTYGFRGEALASIAAVSKLTISTRSEKSDVGYRIASYGGVVRKFDEISKNVGTEIEVRDLFYNTPARKKFLRKTSTEYNKIRDIVLKEALANVDVAFELILDGKSSISTSGKGIENTILDLFGKSVLKNIKKFEYGYLGNVEILRSSKDYIFVYVNKRYVKSNTVERAVIDGYYTKLMKGKYPFSIIFLDIDPKEIDVNVHPSKKIVKFSNDKIIYNQIKDAIDEFFYYNDRENWQPNIDFLKQNVNVENKDEKIKSLFEDEVLKMEQQSLLGLETGLKDNRKTEIVEVQKDIDYNFLNNNQSVENSQQDDISKDEKIEKKQNIEDIMKQLNSTLENNKNYYKEEVSCYDNISTNDNFLKYKNNNNYTKKENTVIEESHVEYRKGTFEKYVGKTIDYDVIGQIFDTYILVRNNNELEIYDQHIIHERILYEELKDIYYNKKLNSQQLLLPQKIEVTENEKSIIMENIEIFKEFGFDIDELHNEIVIRAVPAFDFREDIRDVFMKLFENIRSGRKIMDLRENIIISMSCKGAVKAGQKLDMHEMKNMVRRLHEVGEYTCPHGRPIIVKLTRNDLDKMFGRKK